MQLLERNLNKIEFFYTVKTEREKGIQLDYFCHASFSFYAGIVKDAFQVPTPIHMHSSKNF